MRPLPALVATGMTGEGALTETLRGITYATEKAKFNSAAQLLGAVHRLEDEAGVNPSPRSRELEHFFAQPLIDALGPERYASEQALGATMTAQQAIDLAQSLVE